MTSVRAAYTHAAYLARVADWLDAAEPDDPLHSTAPLDLRQVVYLVDHLGVDPRAVLADGDASGWPLMCGRVERVGRLFRFVTEPGEGVAAIIAVARDQSGVGVELVAWSAREGWAASESGNLGLLGREWLNPLAEEAVDVHAGVLDWLRAGRRGVVMVDRARAVVALREAREITVRDVKFGVTLDRLLTIHAPKIVVEAAA